MKTQFKTRVGAVLLSAVFCLPCSGQKSNEIKVRSVSELTGLPSRIGFGSCGHQDKPMPILNTVVAKEADLFVYLGDNIYGDTKDMSVLQAKYDKLGDKAEFRQLRADVPVLAIWDDHDYGWNDSGKEYEFKSESKQIFLDFWHVPKDSERWKHPGIYGSHMMTHDGKTLQIILLDTRTFRDPLKAAPQPVQPDSGFKNDYQPDDNPEKTLLGESQWQWLEKILREKADLRIICSSIQFGHEYNGWESWTNLPVEQQRMVDLIRQTRANGVIFISGDVHWAEISKREFDGIYPLYDVTASGLTEDWHNVEPNKFRVGDAFRKNHFGMLEVDWALDDPTVTMKIIDVDGAVQLQHAVPLSGLSFQQQ